MLEGGRKVEATGSTRFQKTLWNKIGSDRTSFYIDGSVRYFITLLKNILFYYIVEL